jgi:hypothetical protein
MAAGREKINHRLDRWAMSGEACTIDHEDHEERRESMLL